GDGADGLDSRRGRVVPQAGARGAGGAQGRGRGVRRADADRGDGGGAGAVDGDARGVRRGGFLQHRDQRPVPVLDGGGPRRQGGGEPVPAAAPVVPARPEQHRAGGAEARDVDRGVRRDGGGSGEPAAAGGFGGGRDQRGPGRGAGAEGGAGGDGLAA